MGKEVDLNCLTSSLVTQMMGQSAPPKSADHTKLGGVVNIPDGCVVIHRDIQQAGETGKQEPHEIQQREMPSPTLG